MENIMRFLIDKSEKADEIHALLESRPHRIVKRDGASYIVTADFNPTRMNLEIEAGIIKKVYLG